MTLQVDSNGTLLMLPSGKLMDDCCCEEEGLDCNDCHPSLLQSYTVTISDYNAKPGYDTPSWWPMGVFTMVYQGSCTWITESLSVGGETVYVELYYNSTGSGKWELTIEVLGWEHPSSQGSSDGCSPEGLYAFSNSRHESTAVVTP